MTRQRWMTALILLVALVTSFPARAVQPLNLLRNGNYEIRWASSGAPTFWRWYSNEGSTIAWGSAPRTGGGNVAITRTATGGETLLDNWDTMVPVSQGLNYNFKFAAKGSGQMTVCVGWMNQNNVVIGQTPTYYTLTSSYTSYTRSETAPAGAAKCWIAFRLTGTGTYYVDDTAMWVNTGAEYYQTASINLCQENTPASLLALVTPPDGNSDPAILWDKECRATRNTSAGHYLYFSVADSFMYGGTNVAAVTIEYADAGLDTFALQYDSTGGGAYKTLANITKQGSLQWRRATFYLADAAFSNCQNGQADFRISDNGDGNDYASYVAVSRWDGARINANHLEINGTPTFLKSGWVGADMCNGDVRYRLPYMTAKGYTAASVSAYQMHFDSSSGYGSTTNLNNFLTDANAYGIKVGLTLETGNVGGGAVPNYLFDWYPIQARNSTGALATDTEYGTNLKIQSLFAPGFLNRSRNFITHVLQNADKSKITWYETAVEPQYIGNQLLDYSDAGYDAWRYWLAWRFTLTYLNSIWGTSYTNYAQITMPTASNDPRWGFWQLWRAQGLADWVNGDIQTIRNVVGEKALVAVDTLIVTEMDKRMGDQQTFCETIYPNVFQINWTWAPMSHTPWNDGYTLVTPIARAKNIALSEHMTLNNSDYYPADVDTILRRTLTYGNKFGWGFVNFQNVTTDPFSLYNDNFSPKPLIAIIDNNNAAYMSLANSYLTNPLQAQAPIPGCSRSAIAWRWRSYLSPLPALISALQNGTSI